MKAIQVGECGGTEVLQLVDVPVPARKAGQVLVKTVSAGVNPVDLLVRSGAYKPTSFPKVCVLDRGDAGGELGGWAVRGFSWGGFAHESGLQDHEQR